MRCKKYLFVAAATFMTRFAIEGGLNQERACTLSDLHIQRADACRTIGDLGGIYKRLLGKIRIEDICHAVGISPSNFSVRFKKETGMSPKEYRDRHYHAHWSSEIGTWASAMEVPSPPIEASCRGNRG